MKTKVVMNSRNLNLELDRAKVEISNEEKQREGNRRNKRFSPDVYLAMPKRSD